MDKIKEIWEALMKFAEFIQEASDVCGVLILAVTILLVLIYCHNQTLIRILNNAFSEEIDTFSRTAKKPSEISELILASLTDINNIQTNINAMEDEELLEFITGGATVKYLIGEGGSGKSSMLLYFASKLRDRTKRKTFLKKDTPIVGHLLTYHDFEQLPDCSGSQILNIIRQRITVPGGENKISATVEEHLRKRFIDADKMNWKDYQRKRRRGKGYGFKLVLLIDGYNEFESDIRDMLNREISAIRMDARESVCVIMTSRYADKQSDISVYRLDELNGNQIVRYIKEQQKAMPDPINMKFGLTDENAKAFLKRPILLSMYCDTCTSIGELDGVELPLHTIESVSDIYWNYMCSHLFTTNNRAVSTAGKELLARKAVVLFYILPYIAMQLEAKRKMEISPEDLGYFVELFFRNKAIFTNYRYPGLDKIIKDSSIWDEVKAWSANQLRSYLIEEISVMEYSGSNYRFTHELHRNFYAAVYRMQRDIATLKEPELPRNIGLEVGTLSREAVRYTYSHCEILPDISLAIRKFYYELIAYYFRHLLSDKKRRSLARSSVRYNNLMSDLYYYGDAQLAHGCKDLVFCMDKGLALKSAERAIQIGENRIREHRCAVKQYDIGGKRYAFVKDAAEADRYTDMLLLCWARWTATHIIQNFPNQINQSGKTIEEYRADAYAYSKANSYAVGFGEYFGSDKLAQMLYSGKFLSSDVMRYELTHDEEGKRLETPMDVLDKCIYYLQPGKAAAYHFSFNKHALWLETSIRNLTHNYDKFQNTVKEIYALLVQSYQCRAIDYYALSRILFYRICYSDIIDREYLEQPGKDTLDVPIPELISNANNQIYDQLQFYGPNEIYGYENFCENAGFWYIMKIFSDEKVPDMKKTKDFLFGIVEHGADAVRENDIHVDAVEKAYGYYSRLVQSVLDSSSGNALKLKEEQPGKFKTLCKGVISCSFLLELSKAFGEELGLPDVCEAQNMEIVCTAAKEYLDDERINRFFHEERYSLIYQCYCILTESGGEACGSTKCNDQT